MDSSGGVDQGGVTADLGSIGIFARDKGIVEGAMDVVSATQWMRVLSNREIL